MDKHFEKPLRRWGDYAKFLRCTPSAKYLHVPFDRVPSPDFATLSDTVLTDLLP